MILSLQKLKQYFSLPDFPCSITSNGTKATINIPNHNFRVGDYINITGTNTSLDGQQLVIARPNNNSVEILSTYNGSANAVIKQYDEIVQDIIDQTENYIKNFCDMEYGNTVEKTETYDLGLNGIILPKRGYIQEDDVKEIKLSRSNNFSDPSQHIVLDSTDFFVYEDHIELMFSKAQNYLNCRKAVRMTYTTQDCPKGLSYIALQIAEYHFRNFNDKSIVEVSRTINGDQRTFAKTLPQQIIDDLTKYRRVSLGEPY